MYLSNMFKSLSVSTIRSVARDTGLERYILPYMSADETADDAEAGPSISTQLSEGTLRIEATDIEWDLVGSERCRRAVITALKQQEADEIIIQNDGLEYQYTGNGVTLFSAAGRFIQLLGDRNDRLADTAAIDPLAVADELRNRAGPIADLGVESNLISAASGIDSYSSVLQPTVGLSIGGYRIDQEIPEASTLVDVSTLENGSKVKVYQRPDTVPLYALTTVDVSLSAEDRSVIIDGYGEIAEGRITGNRTASRAIGQVADGSYDPVLTSILRKHTNGYGILEDLFADPRVSDVYATSPVSANPLRVVVDGESMTTNVHLSPAGAGALGSRIRRMSGRAFSRANPSVDATARLNNGTTVRIAGVTEPVVEETAFAFRETSDDKFTLPMLVQNGTMSAEVAAFLSVAVERNAAALIAGTRGAGKTTLLGTLLYELTADTRTVVIEDTPELPVATLQSASRDVQALRTGTGDGTEISAVDALRTALRLGDGALVVGEIRGEEARVLYEAMRVGANANAVLGTIHGDGAEEVYERVVHDLNVPPTSFGATDLVVTVQAYRTPEGRKRRLSRIEGVIATDGEIRFEPLYVIDEDTAVSTGRIDRGESRFVDALTGPAETYADIRSLIEERKTEISTLATDGRATPHEVAEAYAGRGMESS